MRLTKLYAGVADGALGHDPVSIGWVELKVVISHVGDARLFEESLPAVSCCPYGVLASTVSSAKQRHNRTL